MRSIIPLYEECSDILIKTNTELNEFLNKGNTLSELRFVTSGDAERLAFSYSDEDLIKRIKERESQLVKNTSELERLNFFIPGEMDIFGSKFELTSGEYSIKSNTISGDNLIMGYHRQKTRLIIPNGLKVNGKNKLSFLMFKKGYRGEECFIYVEKNSELTINHSILDGITIVVQDGGKLILEDVEVNGGIHGIVQFGEGVVEIIKNVSFSGVAYQYHFEKLSKQTAVNIIDFDKSEEIVDFTIKSKAQNIQIYKSLDFRDKDEVRFKNEVNFFTTEESEIELLFNKIIVQNGMGSGANIKLISEIKVRDVENATIAIDKLVGELIVEDSNDVIIMNTRFLLSQRSKALVLDRSKVRIFNSQINGDGKNIDSGTVGVEMFESQINIQNLIIDNVQEAFTVKKEKKDEDVISKELQENTHNKIYFNGLKISNTQTVLHATSSVEIMAGETLIVEKVYDAFLLKNVKFSVNRLLMKDITGQAFSFGRSNVEILGEDSIMENIENGIVFEDHTYAEIGPILMKRVRGGVGVTVEESIFIAKKTRFEKIETAIFAKNDALFVNDDASFIAIKNPLQKEHGAKPQMSYQEYLIEIEKGSRSE